MYGTLLLVEDDPFQRIAIKSLIEKKLHFEVLEAEDGKQALEILARESQRIQIVILDIMMPGMNGLECLEQIRQLYTELPVIMLSGSEEIGDAVTSMKLGAVDFLNKPPQPERLSVSIHNALKLSGLTKEVTRLKRRSGDQMTFSDLIGYNQGLADIVSVARKAAATDIPVLISGETGVGKELFARALHGESHRAGKPFIAVNCGAIPENLVESTLFGHEKGSFTGAIAKSLGKFREAEGGTLFLDEVGELPLEAQVKLLRALQQKEIEPVGAGHPVRINVRVISATNRNLPDEVRAGRFREDLFFRLDVLPVRIPSLRERKSDIPLLINYFIERFVSLEGLPFKTISDSAMDGLRKRNWPGNIRELENVIRRALLLAETDVIELEDLTAIIRNAAAGDSATAPTSPSATGAIQLSLMNANGSMKTLEQIEAEAMRHAMAYCEDNITRASELLGIAKSTFYRKWGELLKS